MYFSAFFFGRRYFGPGYWAAKVSSDTDCSGGPYVETGYWEYGYAQCDLLPLTNVIYGPIRWGHAPPRARRREDDADAHRARHEAWDAIERARREDAQRAIAARAPRTRPETPATPPPITVAAVQAQAAAESNPAKRNAMLALLLILNEA